MARRFINGNDVNRIDGVRNSLLIYDHNDFGMERDEIFVRHAEFLAVPQLQRERMKTILQAASDLLNNHGGNVSSRRTNSILQLQPRIRHRAEAGRC